MHIGVLTLPLNSNYGGILQAFALCRYLESIGHSATLITRRKNHGSPIKNGMAHLKWTIIPILEKTPIAKNFRLTAVETFKKQNFTRRSPPLFTKSELVDFCRKENFDLILVGSDQTWNPNAAPDLYNYYLDFCSELPDTVRASYACSFAQERWEYTEEETQVCAELVRKHIGISVREDSGISFVYEKFGQEALLHVDPTLLLPTSEYEKFVSRTDLSNFCFNYILDDGNSKKDLSDRLCELIEKPRIQLDRTLESPQSVESWLSCMHNCDFVFTDSFHGTLFAIINRKHFITVCNHARGAARFRSLLGRLGLLDRMVDPDNPELERALSSPLDWDEVEEKIQPWIQESKKYLDNLPVGVKID